MNNPQTIADYYMEQMRHLANEVVICAYFDVKSRFLGDKFISKGSLSSSVVDIGSIIRTALDKMHQSLFYCTIIQAESVLPAEMILLSQTD